LHETLVGHQLVAQKRVCARHKVRWLKTQIKIRVIPIALRDYSRGRMLWTYSFLFQSSIRCENSLLYYWM